MRITYHGHENYEDKQIKKKNPNTKHKNQNKTTKG
jgi:hypothetical protein